MRAEDQFWAQVTKSEDPNGCWVHGGARGSHGYPQTTRIGERYETAHRASWIFSNGPIPRGLWVLHKCNNKPCVRPDHLYLGTHKQNMDDLCRAGHPRRKLTSDNVRAIRASRASLIALAHEFNVSSRTVHNIRKGVTYRYEGRDELITTPMVEGGAA